MEALTLKHVPNTTEKSFGITGDTYPIKEQLKAAGGCYSEFYGDVNPRTGKKSSWLFSKKKETAILAQFGIKQADTATQIAVKAKTPATRRKAATKPKTRAKAKPEPKGVKAESVKPEIALNILLGVTPNSPSHLALQYFLSGGKVKPQDVSRQTGLFGKDERGSYGETERKSVFWLLRNDAPSLDTIAMDLCQDHKQFHPEDVENALMETVCDYAGSGGKSRMIEECTRLYKDVEFLPF